MSGVPRCSSPLDQPPPRATNHTALRFRGIGSAIPVGSADDNKLRPLRWWNVLVVGFGSGWFAFFVCGPFGAARCCYISRCYGLQHGVSRLVVPCFQSCGRGAGLGLRQGGFRRCRNGQGIGAIEMIRSQVRLSPGLGSKEQHTAKTEHDDQ